MISKIDENTYESSRRKKTDEKPKKMTKIFGLFVFPGTESAIPAMFSIDNKKRLFSNKFNRFRALAKEKFNIKI